MHARKHAREFFETPLHLDEQSVVVGDTILFLNPRTPSQVPNGYVLVNILEEGMENCECSSESFV